MTSGLAEAEQELRRFPSSVVDEFNKAAEKLRPEISESDLVSWAQQGVEIARQTVRSWEAASEFFFTSPDVLKHLSAVQLKDWGHCGNALCRESPSLAVAFFRASPKSLAHLRPRFIQGWANLGKNLYRGTWKSSALAAKFFDSSASLLENLGYNEVERFAELVDLLSHKSSDLAAECLVLGEQVLPKIGDDRLAFMRLSQSVAETNWREVKGCFESVPRLLAHLNEGQRARFMGLAGNMAQAGMPNISLFLKEGATSLGRVGGEAQDYFMALAESLLPISHESVAAFLASGPGLLGRINEAQIGAWFEQGVTILNENQDGGLAYFKVESNTSEAVLEMLSAAVDLDRVKEVLRMYCRALAGATVDIANTQELMAKNIGWVSENQATTEGSTVFLPPAADRYGSKDENFSLFKVVATHQVSHIEFGSFGFSFESPSSRFQDARQAREETLQKQRTGGSPTLVDSEAIEEQESAIDPGPQAQGANGHAPGTELDGAGSAERGYLTDMGRFFDLFPMRKLALDIFTVVEDARLDFRIKSDYSGMAPAYRRVQADSLEERPPIHEMPLQEAMVEFLVRFSLQQYKGLPAPVEYHEYARLIAEIARRLLSAEAMVEDSAEATIRIYDVISDMPNEQIPEDLWSEMDLDDEELPDEQLEELLNQLRASSQAPPSGEEEDYESPPQVDYRGDFKPELSQLLTMLREQDQSGDPQAGTPLSKEMLEQLLANSPELELDAESGQFDNELNMFVQNLMKEAGSQTTDEPGQGYGPIPHEDEDGGALETKEPRSFVYDEWDFRANDYKPRWCIVREKPMSEGETQFHTETLHSHASLMGRIRRQFEMLMPETLRKVKHLPDGDDFDLDAVIEAVIDKWAGESPSDKVHWRRNKVERDVAVVFLLDMSASTAEAIDESRRSADDWDAPDDPVEYMVWLRARRGESQRRSYKRIIDLEKESIVLLINALETIGDTYGIYGFSGYGRENVEFYVIKDIEEHFSERIKRRIDKITPLHATRMGPAIRHAIRKLEKQDARTKLLFLISDGRPQDRGYSREGVEKEYAVHDTKMALTEARRKAITPFCLTVDKAGHDYLATMCQDMGYEVLADINALPSRLPMLYRKLTI